MPVLVQPSRFPARRRLAGVAGALLLAALPARSSGQETPEEVLASGFFKLAALLSGDGDAVTLSEAEANALLAAEPAAEWLLAEAGLRNVRVRFFPGQAHFIGAMPGDRMPAALGPLLGAAAGEDHPVDVTLGLSGADGVGRGGIERGSLAGLELPPDLLAELVLEGLAGLTGVPEQARSAIRAGTAFPLPWRIEGIEVRSGEVRLTPRGP